VVQIIVFNQLMWFSPQTTTLDMQKINIRF